MFPMFLSDFSSEIHTSLTINKIRSGLTILGIVIGIASVIVMVAIGQGAQENIEDSIQAVGSNLLIIRPGSQQGPGSEVRGAQGSAESLTNADVTALKEQLMTLERAAPEINVGRKQVTSQGKNTNTSVTGVTSEQALVRNIKAAQGTFLTPDQERNLAKVAFLGPDVATELFGSGNTAVGKRLRIGAADFTVIGVATPRGGTGFGSSDDFIYIPLATARQFFSGSQYLSLINIQVKSGADMTAAANEATSILRRMHKLDFNDELDFRIMNQADIVATASSVTSTFTTLLGAVAGISLIVGGIGIMNMMLTTVTERTREIGLRKALGAKGKDIRLQFLFEAMLLTMLGGIVGVLIGFLVTLTMNSLGVRATLDWNSVILATVVSTVIGVVFGYYPAGRAARLSPIEALRYE